MLGKDISRFDHLLSWSILGLLALVLCFGLLVPIYSDEVAIHMVKARFLLEGGQIITLLPQCETSVTTQVPLTWYPAALLYSFVYALPGGLGLRLTGIALGLSYLSLLWFWVGKLFQNTNSRNVFRALIIAINGLGVLPLILTLARSEQVLVLSMILLCLFSIFWYTTEIDSRSVRTLKVLSFLLLASTFYYTHPKALFFSPFVLNAAFYIFRKENLYVNAVILSAIVFAAYQALQQANNLGCPGAPIISKTLSRVTIDFQLLSTSVYKFFEIGVDNLLSSLSAVVRRLLFASSYQSAWLPGLDSPRLADGVLFLNFAIEKSLILGVACLLLMLLFQLARQLVRRQISREIALAVGLLGGLLVHGFVYNANSWHFYTPSLIIPIFTIMFLLVVPSGLTYTKVGERIWYYVSCYVAVLSLVSIVCLSLLVFPPLLKAAQENKYMISGQPLSTSIFLNKTQKTDLMALASSCNISADSSRRLVLDGTAYFQFKNQREPINILYISEFGFGADIANKTKVFLNKIGSDGLISRCDYLPEALKGDVIKRGDMCCVSKFQWQK